MKKPQTMPARYKIIEAITAPLGFFVLALLIVEAFLASVLIGGNLEKQDQLTGVWIGVALFVFVIIAVWILVWFKPAHLTFDKDAHLVDRGKVPYGTDSRQVGDPGTLTPTESQQRRP
jgi:protein-S-isoprenylcysteine O-methyltransferase Ste14